MDTTVQIPTNYTDAGKLLGIFEIRRALECAVICIPIIWAVAVFSPFGLTGSFILASVLVVPAGGFALMGICDHSVVKFIKLYSRWRKKRALLIYRGSKPIVIKEGKKCQG